jgi:hypothetical protein
MDNQRQITVKGLSISKCNDIEKVFTIDRKEDEDIITTCGHRIGWDWNSNLGTVVWNKSGRRIMHCVTID